MSDRTCAHPDCESVVPVSPGRGRPRKFCLTHGEKMVRRPCSDCGNLVTVNARRTLSPVCHPCRRQRPIALSSLPGYIPPSRRANCAACEKPIQRGGTSASVSYCLDCRRDGLAPSNAKCGTDRKYAQGCRCAECRDHQRIARAHYRRKRAAEGRPLHLARKTIVRTCPGCNETFGARADNVQAGQGVYCSRRCKTLTETGVDIDSPDWEPPNRFRINAKIRAAIYERDGFTCWLCGDPVKPDADTLSDWYPSLDHVIPRSRGGSDNPENLRCAHRLCNSIKGSKEVSDALADRDLEVAV